MKLNTTAFTEGGPIPKKYARDGANVNPPLHLDDIPDHAKSLALIVDDPDAPSGTFNHWLVTTWIPRRTTSRRAASP